jgi:CRP/FNR family cyclic AMP-dependent transcriptional regulator
MTVPARPPVRQPATVTLDDDLLRAISARGGQRNFPAHSVLVNEDDDSDSIFIVAQGVGEGLRRRRERSRGGLQHAGPGEYFGEMTLDGGRRARPR